MPNNALKQFMFTHPISYGCIAALLVVGFLIVRYLSRKERPDFAPRPILTPNEVEFFHRLSHALPSYLILPQVAMSALIRPNLHENDPNYIGTFRRYSQKVVDYVVCERETINPVVIIELDDSTHDNIADHIRDTMLNSAGYSVIRWDSRSKPSTREIQDAIAALA